jgi:hypothetical protein
MICTGFLKFFFFDVLGTAIIMQEGKKNQKQKRKPLDRFEVRKEEGLKIQKIVLLSVSQTIIYQERGLILFEPNRKYPTLIIIVLLS